MTDGLVAARYHARRGENPSNERAGELCTTEPIKVPRLYITISLLLGHLTANLGGSAWAELDSLPKVREPEFRQLVAG